MATQGSKQGLEVGFDRVFGQVKALTDHLVGQAFSQQIENFQLPGRDAQIPGRALTVHRAGAVAYDDLFTKQQLGDGAEQGGAVGCLADKAGRAQVHGGIQVTRTVAGGENGNGYQAVDLAQLLQQGQAAAVG